MLIGVISTMKFLGRLYKLGPCLRRDDGFEANATSTSSLRRQGPNFSTEVVTAAVPKKAGHRSRQSHSAADKSSVQACLMPRQPMSRRHCAPLKWIASCGNLPSEY
jgi:hypothetical protein